MFGTKFGGGYDNYASQQSRVDLADKAQQKSVKISQATKGKKKQRKAENKGKHRRVVKSKEENVSLKSKNVGDVDLSVQFIRQKNRAGQGRPTQSSQASRAVRGLSVAFPEKKKEGETIAQAVAREIAKARPNAPPPPPARRDADARAEVRRRELAEIRRQEEREEDRADRKARDDADREQRKQESTDRRAMEERIARQPAQVPDIRIDAGIAQGAINFAPVIEGARIENVGNPVVNVTGGRRERGVGTAPHRRDRSSGSGSGGGRGRGAGGGGGLGGGLSSSDSDAPPPTPPSNPTPRTRRERQASHKKVRPTTSEVVKEVRSVFGRTTTGRTPTPVLSLAQDAITGTVGAVGEVISGGASPKKTPIELLEPEPEPEEETTQAGDQEAILADIASQVSSSVGAGLRKGVNLVTDGLKVVEETVRPHFDYDPLKEGISGGTKRLQEKAEFSLGELSSEGEQAGTIYGGESSSGESATSYSKFAGGGGAFSEAEEGLLEVGEGGVKSSPSISIPTKKQQEENPMEFLEAYVKTGGDVARPPTTPPLSPVRAVLKLPQDKPSSPPSFYGIVSGDEEELARKAKLRFESEEAEKTRTASQEAEIRKRERQQRLEEEEIFKLDSDISSGGETDRSGYSTRSSSTTGSLSREEKDLSGIGSLGGRLRDLKEQLRRVERDLLIKQDKQGKRRIEIHKQNIVRDIGIMELAIAEDRGLGELVTETEERYYQSPTQGGVREGTGRPRKEGQSEEVNATQDNITSKLQRIRTMSGFKPASSLKESQVTKGNKSKYQIRVEGIGKDAQSVRSIMDLYTEVLELKSQLRVLKKL
tara:strand:- start:1250 stop:3718 length:2469 start_codon:yes stop_codon:yes gene_type:complete